MKNIKVIKKILIIVLLIICTNIIFISSNSLASTEFNYNTYTPGTPTGYNRAITLAGNILALVRNIGIVIGVIALSIIGVKYMLGSVEEKADYKKSMIPFVIGAIFLIIGPTIVKIIYDMVSKML